VTPIEVFRERALEMLCFAKDMDQKPSNNSCAFRVHQPELDEDEVLGMNPAFIDLDERKVSNFHFRFMMIKKEIFQNSQKSGDFAFSTRLRTKKIYDEKNILFRDKI